MSKSRSAIDVLLHGVAAGLWRSPESERFRGSGEGDGMDVQCCLIQDTSEGKRRGGGQGGGETPTGSLMVEHFCSSSLRLF